MTVGDPLHDLLERMRTLQPEELYTLLLQLRQSTDNEASGRDTSLADRADAPSFDELAAWAQARRRRARQDASRLADLLPEAPAPVAHSTRARDVEMLTPQHVAMQLHRGRGRAFVELDNDTAFAATVRLVAGRGSDPHGRPVSVQLVTPWRQLTLAAGERSRLELALICTPGPAGRRVLVPVEARGEREVLGRFWLDACEVADD